MKQLVCEMCGSTDLVKDGGVFVCQSCGCKYSVEEAKKMMVEGTVEVTGTVTVDESKNNADKIEKYLELAESALEGNDTEGVVSYCDRVLELDPDNHKAWYIRAMSAGWGSTLQNMKFAQTITAAKRAINLAPNNLKTTYASNIYLSSKAQIVSLMQIVTKMPITVGGTYMHNVMQAWGSLLKDIPFLSISLMNSEIEDCKKACINSQMALAPRDRYIFSGWEVYNGRERYDITFSNALKEKMDEARKLQNEIIEQYFESHPEENKKMKEYMELVSNSKEWKELQTAYDEKNKAKKSIDGMLFPTGKKYKELVNIIKEQDKKIPSLKNAFNSFAGKMLEEIKNIEEQAGITDSWTDEYVVD